MATPKAISRLNGLGELLLEEKENGNDAAVAKTKNDIFLMVYSDFPEFHSISWYKDNIQKTKKMKTQKETDISSKAAITLSRNFDPSSAISEFYTKDIHRFRSGNLYDFFCKYLPLRAIDADKRDIDYKGPKGKRTIPVSIYKPIGNDDDDTLTIEGTLASGYAKNTEALLLLEDSLVELASLLLRVIPQVSEGIIKSFVRPWFYLFFTEDMTYVWKETDQMYQHERDIFDAMDLEYLDYYMTQKCLTGHDVYITPLKPYKETSPYAFHPKGAPDITPVPIPQDVSNAFMRAVRGLHVPNNDKRKKAHSIYDVFVKAVYGGDHEVSAEGLTRAIRAYRESEKKEKDR